ncbi:MAG TPA: ABC transporter permease [Novimethylophilus sp.]|jgi:phospholipid/cholesterol/gamma-HCH transport system permease protein|uniref:ABC transporter permease n=1 Tax=Novimethylophilus sp. TaxID=2137426 RepID=UPI002F40F6EE
MADATFRVDDQPGGGRRVMLAGCWSLRQVENNFADLREQLRSFFADPFLHWDLTEVEQLDSAGAAMLLAGWGHRIDRRMQLLPEQAAQFAMLMALPRRHTIGAGQGRIKTFFQHLWDIDLAFVSHVVDFIGLLGSLALELLHLLRHPHEIPWKEISANVYKGGVLALPVTGLVGFMIGIAMSYLMALQLRKFGADIFIVNILGLAIIRELGPILMAVLVAGRSGSAMTAQIGVMRVTEEIDALATMGISRILRLILPKVVGLTLVAPLLVFWTSCWALMGGMLAANLQLGIGFEFFLDHLPRVVKPVNLSLSMLKALMFGLLVTLVACHFGLRVKPNTESLSSSTTTSVVVAITAVILVDAIFAILTRGVGL